MKKFIVLFLAVLLAPQTFADNSVSHSQISDTGSAYVPCLDLTVQYSVLGTVVSKVFYDGSGQGHLQFNGHYVSQTYEEGTDMSWSTRGTVMNVRKINFTSDQEVFRYSEHDVSIADGDYPNLLWRYTIIATFNANGEPVQFRLTDSQFSCVAD